MSRRATAFVLALIAALAPIACVMAQGSRADYQRADTLRHRVQGKVFRTRVQPHWTPDGGGLWYRVDSGPDRHRFVWVDAAAGKRQEAFDHQRLADSLAKASGDRFDAQRLPLRALDLAKSGKMLRFTAAGKRWQCDLTAYNVTPDEAQPGDSGDQTTVAVLPGPRPSGRNGEEVELLFVNRTDDKLRLYWINAQNDRRFYQDLEPGVEHRQHTYGGHVWLAIDERERIRGVYQATDADGVAVIDGSWRSGQRRQGRTGGRRRGSRSRPRSRNRSPDGRWTASIEDHNVVVRDLENDQTVNLTNNGSESDPYRPRFFWSPNSKKLVVLQERPAEERRVHVVESSPRDQLQPKLHSFNYAKPGDQLAHPRPRLFDLEKQSQLEVSEELYPNPWSIRQIRWASDSTRFTFLYNQRGHQVLRVVAVDASTGEAKPIIDEVSDTFICYSGKMFFRHLEETGEMIWMSERDGWNHLYLYDDKSGEVKNQITQGRWVVRSVDRVNEQNRQIWFQAGGIHPGQDPYYVHHCRVNFDGSEMVVLTEADGTHRLEYSPDRKHFLDTYSRVDLPPVTELRRTSDGSLVCLLEEGDWSNLVDSGWQPPLPFVAKGRDGETDIHGVIFRPTTFDPDKKYPVIEKIYAGPQSAHVPKRFSSYHSAQAMAELGFVVVQIDGMGTSHRSKKFHDVCWKNLGDSGFPDRILWLKAAAAKHPWIDLSRVGIYGGSAGGQNAMRALIAHGDFYHAAVADCGCHDNRMDKIWWNEQWMGWPVGPHYAQSSNVNQAHRLQGHLLLIVGELDRNVDPASTMQVVNALIKADKDFQLLVIPGAGHGAGGGRYGTRRRRDFFVRHLWGVEPREGDKVTR